MRLDYIGSVRTKVHCEDAGDHLEEAPETRNRLDGYPSPEREDIS